MCINRSIWRHQRLNCRDFVFLVQAAPCLILLGHIVNLSVVLDAPVRCHCLQVDLRRSFCRVTFGLRATIQVCPPVPSPKAAVDRQQPLSCSAERYVPSTQQAESLAIPPAGFP